MPRVSTPALLPESPPMETYQALTKAYLER